jgi:NADH:ubiquinone oxidoreductase subunit C
MPIWNNIIIYYCRNRSFIFLNIKIEKTFCRFPVYTHERLYIFENWIDRVAKFYKNYSLNKFNVFIDIVVIDIPRKENRFIIKYLFLSFLRKRLELVFEVNELSTIKSLAFLFNGAS